MVRFSDGLEMSCFSGMESSFCFANVEFITVPATSFIDDRGPLRSVQEIFVWKIGFDAACVLEYELEIDERVEIVFQTFGDSVTVKTKGNRINISFLGTVA